jgi:hypothetical protein
MGQGFRALDREHGGEGGDGAGVKPDPMALEDMPEGFPVARTIPQFRLEGLAAPADQVESRLARRTRPADSHGLNGPGRNLVFRQARPARQVFHRMAIEIARFEIHVPIARRGPQDRFHMA